MNHIPPHMTASYNRSNASTPSFQQYHQQPQQQQQAYMLQQQQLQQQQQVPFRGGPIQPQPQQPQQQPQLTTPFNNANPATNSAGINCKVYLPDDEVRRFRVTRDQLNFDTIFKRCLYDGIQQTQAKLYYKDEEGDWVRVTNEMEWKEGMPILMQNKASLLLKFRVRVTPVVVVPTATTISKPSSSPTTASTLIEQPQQQQVKEDLEVSDIFDQNEEPSTARNNQLEDSFANIKLNNSNSSPAPVESHVKPSPFASNEWEMVPPSTQQNPQIPLTSTPQIPSPNPNTFPPQHQYMPSPHTPQQVQNPYYNQPAIAVPATMTQSWFNQQQQQQQQQQQPQQPYLQQQPQVHRDYTLELNNLAGMGFSDKSRNLQLLQKHNGELAKVVAELCGN